MADEPRAKRVRAVSQLLAAVSNVVDATFECLLLARAPAYPRHGVQRNAPPAILKFVGATGFSIRTNRY